MSIQLENYSSNQYDRQTRYQKEPLPIEPSNWPLYKDVSNVLGKMSMFVILQGIFWHFVKIINWFYELLLLWEGIRYKFKNRLHLFDNSEREWAHATGVIARPDRKPVCFTE